MCICVRGPSLARLAIVLVPGNERWTVNLVPARITRRAGAPPPNNLLKFWYFRNFRNFKKNELLKSLHQMELSSALSFLHFMSSIQSFNTLSKIIMSLSPALVDDIIFQNNISMVMCTCVRGSTLARLAMVLVPGNERWTVNLVPARITRRAGAPPSENLDKFRSFSKFSKFQPNFELLKKFASDRTLSWYYHFYILLALSKASIHYIKLFLKLTSTCLLLTKSKTTFPWLCASACAAPLWLA